MLGRKALFIVTAALILVGQSSSGANLKKRAVCDLLLAVESLEIVPRYQGKNELKDIYYLNGRQINSAKAKALDGLVVDSKGKPLGETWPLLDSPSLLYVVDENGTLLQENSQLVKAVQTEHRRRYRAYTGTPFAGKLYASLYHSSFASKAKLGGRIAYRKGKVIYFDNFSGHFNPSFQTAFVFAKELHDRAMLDDNAHIRIHSGFSFATETGGLYIFSVNVMKTNPYAIDVPAALAIKLVNEGPLPQDVLSLLKLLSQKTHGEKSAIYLLQMHALGGSLTEHEILNLGYYRRSSRDFGYALKKLRDRSIISPTSEISPNDRILMLEKQLDSISQ